MAEPLKNHFGDEVVEWLGAAVATVDDDFTRADFTTDALDGLGALELTERARHVGDVLAGYLPEDRKRALGILTRAVTTAPSPPELSGMGGFAYLPIVYFAADHGVEEFEAAMTLQYEVTKRFTAEFSIRTFLTRYPEATLARLTEWADDPDVHVRRLVSEGTRPRLPWAPRLRGFQVDPTPVLELLELLKDDPEEHVRRSVANNLNDIAKDHPDLVIEVARRWWEEGDANRRRLVRHGLRTLVKQGDPDALAILGYGADSPIRIESVIFDPTKTAIGERVRIVVALHNPAAESAGALVDLRVHFVKKDGSTRPKVFKGGEVEVQPGEFATIRKTVSVAQQSTRTHYPGHHAVEVLVNGVAHAAGGFDLQ